MPDSTPAEERVTPPGSAPHTAPSTHTEAGASRELTGALSHLAGGDAVPDTHRGPPGRPRTGRAATASDARRRLAANADQAPSEHEPVCLARRGRKAAAAIGADGLEELLALAEDMWDICAADARRPLHELAMASAIRAGRRWPIAVSATGGPGARMPPYLDWAARPAGSAVTERGTPCSSRVKEVDHDPGS